jgi:hypothetical protein
MTTDKTDEQFVNLETLAQGGAVELFNEELTNVIANILDPNTKAESVRSVTLKVEIKPTESRSMGNVSVSVQSKLAPPKGTSTVLYFGKKSGKAVATERDPNQLSFDDLTKAGPQAVPINQKK